MGASGAGKSTLLDVVGQVDIEFVFGKTKSNNISSDSEKPTER